MTVYIVRASLLAQMVKNLPAMQETHVWSLVWEDPLEEGIATHSSILAWRIPRKRSLATVHGIAESNTTNTHTHTHTYIQLRILISLYQCFQTLVHIWITCIWDQIYLHNPNNHDGVITHPEPHILECEVKCALGSITTNKASGGDGIPVELFQILKDDAVKVLHSICQQIWKTQQWPQEWKRSVFIPIPKKGNAKECSNYCTITFISHASKVMLKILQARLQQYVNR